MVEGDDSATANYFSKLSAPALAAWAARGVTSVTQTAARAGTTCASYSSNIGDAGILSLIPTAAQGGSSALSR